MYVVTPAKYFIGAGPSTYSPRAAAGGANGRSNEITARGSPDHLSDAISSSVRRLPNDRKVAMQPPVNVPLQPKPLGECSVAPPNE